MIKLESSSSMGVLPAFYTSTANEKDENIITINKTTSAQ
jgi:hypothetical protein